MSEAKYYRGEDIRNLLLDVLNENIKHLSSARIHESNDEMVGFATGFNVATQMFMSRIREIDNKTLIVIQK